jgi:plastocyanin
MKPLRLISAVGLCLTVAGCAAVHHESEMPKMSPEEMASFFMPTMEGSKVVSITTNTNTPVTANILIQTHAIVTKENGSKETLARFGEVYAFSPNFIAVHRDEPTLIRFWNLQGDDNHDFMLISPSGQVLMKALLPPLKETTFVFTFHEEGLFNFICAMHQPGMNGQVFVLPPKGR